MKALLCIYMGVYMGVYIYGPTIGATCIFIYMGQLWRPYCVYMGVVFYK